MPDLLVKNFKKLKVDECYVLIGENKMGINGFDIRLLQMVQVHE